MTSASYSNKFLWIFLKCQRVPYCYVFCVWLFLHHTVYIAHERWVRTEIWTCIKPALNEHLASDEKNKTARQRLDRSLIDVTKLKTAGILGN